MSKPSASDVHVNAPLTAISVAYQQNAAGYVADKVFPAVPVQKQSDRYFVYSKDDWFRSDAQERAPGTESAGGGYTLDNTPNYFARMYSIHKDVADPIRANSDAALDPDRDATQYVTDQLLLRRDKVFASQFMKSGVWGTDLAGVAGAPGGGQVKQWDASGSTPIKDVSDRSADMAEKTGKKPNVLVIGARVFSALRNNADVLDRIKYTMGPAIITEDLLAQLFGLDRVVVGWTTENTAKEGAAGSYAFVHGKKALLLYSEPNPGLFKPSAGYTFKWTGMSGSGPDGTRIKKFRIEERESDRIEGEAAYDLKLVGADLGVFIDTLVA